MSRFTHVVKRSGAIVPFNIDRISNAIYRAAVAVELAGDPYAPY